MVKDEPRIEVCPLLTKYPQGGHCQLIYAVTGRAINSKMLPADAGCIVDNVETIIAVYRAVKLGRPVTNRISTITGDAIANPGNFLYSIPGTYVNDPDHVPYCRSVKARCYPCSIQKRGNPCDFY